MGEKIILFCNCQSRCETQRWIETAGMLKHSDDIHLITVTDLCGWCATEPKKFAGLINNAGKILIIACHTRTVRLLLFQAGIDSTDKFSFFNLIDQNPELLMPVIDDYRRNDAELPSKTNLIADPSWQAWYPVIDNVRCNTCGQCAEFCLFGVYQKTDGKVEVVNPKACKNNCPACARICPRVAIIFPKYTRDGAIGGAESIDEALELKRLQQDTDAILGNDIYQALELRKMNRRSVIRDDAMQKAIRERDEALSNIHPE